MGWWSTNIMGGDSPLDIQSYIYNLSGLSQFPDGYDQDERKFKPEDFDNNPDLYSKLMEKIKNYDEDSKGIATQVFAYMLMEAGGSMSDELREKAMESCDSDEWAMEDPERRERVQNLKKHIENYDGQPVKDLEQDYGVFAAISKKLNPEIDLEVMKARMEEELKELKADERMYYPSASVVTNAPLALVQTSMEAKINLLERMLELPVSTFPLTKPVEETQE